VSRLRANVGLRVRFAVAFAALAALVAVLVGALGYSAAATLIRSDRAKDFQQSLTTLVGDAETLNLSARDFTANPASKEQLVDQLTHSGDIGVQVLGPGGEVIQWGKPDPLPVSRLDQQLARNHTPGKTRNITEFTGGDRYHVVTVSLGGGRAAARPG
jgi:two-component system sensor histidine kinase MprB